ncbi:MAG: NADH-quinone oxidoreductase subunit L [Planctomycetota bacterium]|jgi:NADH-quinone oxidoreductase subunit L
MTAWLEPTGLLGLLAAATPEGPYPVAQAVQGMGWAGWILWLPILSLIGCGVCWALRVKSKLPAWITVAGLGAAFFVTVGLYLNYDGAVTIHLFDWFDISWGTGPRSSLVAHFALYVDKLTLLWMLFVTGLGTLIALYASEYMEPDVGRGYSRFFAGVSVFLFAMSCLVMGDNLLMLYLGWEGVGFASYWLIGYYYQRPSAVEAAKKAFIVNRIGDLGLALGLYLTYHYFGTIQYSEIFAAVQAGVDTEGTAGGWPIKWIPFLLMLGAFGKSAQIPLYVWLPDAMEGPTPVSALIHAATMVTAGVYLLARMFPLMEALHPYALPTVAWIGGLTALLAATIGMAQYDIKRIMAYSTVSQLGYMFMGIGVMTTIGGAYHVFTHAFFKAVLFLTCGAIMHGFAGQLDLRKLSGLRHLPGWRIVSWTMFYACLCLVGFPFISSGFYSKDAIMAEAFVTAGPGFKVLGVIAIITAALTAYYTFRVWFRVCCGEVKYEMGDEHHGDDAHGDDAHGHDEPHAPRWAINSVLLIISAGAVVSIILYWTKWGDSMVADSTAKDGLPPHHEGLGFFQDPHKWMMLVASTVTIVGMGVAYWLHLGNRKAADDLRSRLLANPATRWLPIAAENKWYVDELYHAVIRFPLWVVGHAFYFIDRYLVDMVVVDGIGRTPRWVAKLFQPLSNGILQSYAVSMAGGVGLIALLVIYMPELIQLLNGLFGGDPTGGFELGAAP